MIGCKPIHHLCDVRPEQFHLCMIGCKPEAVGRVLKIIHVFTLAIFDFISGES